MSAIYTKKITFENSISRLRFRFLLRNYYPYTRLYNFLVVLVAHTNTLDIIALVGRTNLCIWYTVCVTLPLLFEKKRHTCKILVFLDPRENTPADTGCCDRSKNYNFNKICYYKLTHFFSTGGFVGLKLLKNNKFCFLHRTWSSIIKALLQMQDIKRKIQNFIRSKSIVNLPCYIRRRT